MGEYVIGLADAVVAPVPSNAISQSPSDNSVESPQSGTEYDFGGKFGRGIGATPELDAAFGKEVRYQAELNLALGWTPTIS